MENQEIIFAAREICNRKLNVTYVSYATACDFVKNIERAELLVFHLVNGEETNFSVNISTRLGNYSLPHLFAGLSEKLAKM